MAEGWKQVGEINKITSPQITNMLITEPQDEQHLPFLSTTSEKGQFHLSSVFPIDHMYTLNTAWVKQKKPDQHGSVIQH